MFGSDVIYFLVDYCIVLQIDGLVLYVVGSYQIDGDFFGECGQGFVCVVCIGEGVGDGGCIVWCWFLFLCVVFVV